MYCAGCGTRADDGSYYCARCGRPLAGEAGGPRRAVGRVTSFERGYGHISALDGSDVFVHYSAIAMGSRSTLHVGEFVEFQVAQVKGGYPIASDVTEVGAPGQDFRALPRARGVIRSFSWEKGCGFIAREGAPDVFVHISVVEMNPSEFLLQGDVVEFSVVQGAVGPVAIRVAKLLVPTAQAKSGGRKPEPNSQDCQGGADSGRGERPEPRERGAQLSPWDVLGVARGASYEEIGKAYRHMAQIYHPDKVAGLAPEFKEIAERRMKEINAAYEELRRDSMK